ncbi:MAG: hypothetical protein M9952_14690 [Microthrixaceae bacterium]|nr:hypothetical protein [Microthrixaceae bacterium]MCO5314170.1 hypothetical protein [Microthrixaceae bacterium]
MDLEARHRRQRRSPDLRTQRGATLVLVLVGMVLTSIIAIAIAAYSVTVNRVTASTIQMQAAWRQADGHLERAVREYRLDPAAVGVSCVGRWSTNPTWLPSPYSLTCESSSLTAVPSDGRIATIELHSNSRLVGLARVRIEDKQGSAPLTGSTLTVCAWQVGQVDVSEVASCA